MRSAEYSSTGIRSAAESRFAIFAGMALLSGSVITGRTFLGSRKGRVGYRACRGLPAGGFHSTEGA